MRKLRGLALVPLMLGVAAAACGGESEEGSPSSGGTNAGGSAGASTGGAGTGGAAGGGALGGAAGAGAVGGGGTAGADSGPVVPPCDDPSDPTKAALCLTIAPDAVKLLPADAALDGKGVLAIAVYDTPFPDTGDAGSVAPLAAVLAPIQPDGGIVEGTLSDLVQNPYRFAGLPATVYVQAFFFDDTSILGTSSDPVAGTWVGGYDFSNGLVESPPIVAVPLTIGSGTNHSLALHPLRKLSIKVSRATGTAPAGDGQGPLAIIATQTTALTPTTKLFGFGSVPCADLSGSGSVTVDGVLLGSGAFYVTGVLDDFGLGTSDLPAGSLASLVLSGGTPQIPAKNKISAANDYWVQGSIELGYLNPAPDAGSDSTSCTAIGDAGTD